MDFSRRHVLVTLLAAPLAPAWGQTEADEALLTKEQEERLKKYLPRTFPKLQRRDPVFVAVCGDEISAFHEPGASPSPSGHLMSWYGRFLDRLGAAFFYHGGVVDMNAPAGKPGKELEKQWEEYRKLRAQWEKTGKGEPPKIPGVPEREAGGPERIFSVNDLLRLTQPPEGRVPISSSFFARNYAEEGAVAVQVFGPLLNLVFHAEEKAATDLVMIAYGARDALDGNSLATFRTVLEAAIAECRAKGADVILAGPPPAMDEAEERAAIGRSRPWAAVMREVADAAGIFFADLGAAAVYQPSDLLNRTVGSTFRASIEPVRKMFDHGAKIQDGLHPNAAAHLRMGETTADWLKNGEPVRPFRISGPKESPYPQLNIGAGPNGEDVLTIRVASLAKEPLTIGLCPLRVAGWLVKPGSPDRVHTFKMDTAEDPSTDPSLPPRPWPRLFRFVMVRNSEFLPGHEEFIRGSLIISDDDAQHLVDLKVQLRPLAMLWPEERLDGAAGDSLLKCTLVNTGDEEIDALLTLDWLGRRIPLPGVKVAAGERQPVPVRLPLPPVESAFRFKDVIVVNVAAGGRSWKFTRSLEGVRHAGLNQKLPLVPLSRWRSKATAEDAAAAGAQLTVLADQKAIYFLLDVPVETRSDEVNDKPWGRLEVQMDGRKPGKNGTLGFVGTVVMEIPRDDRPGRILLPVPTAVFGYGDAAQCRPESFLNRITTRPDGGRRIEFNMARANLKEHEWSLDGGGQNDLGVNLRLFLCDGSAGGYSDAKTFVLSASSFPPPDARSLTLLELHGNPAARWSLRIG